MRQEHDTTSRKLEELTSDNKKTQAEKEKTDQERDIFISKYAKLLNDNKRLQNEIGSLREKHVSVNMQGTDKTPPTTKDDITAAQIIAALPPMATSTITNFLIKMIPKVSGGIKCEELLNMVSHANSYDIDRIVSSVATNIKRPISNTCIQGLSSSMVSSQSSRAIDALLSPDRK